jgi:hypothetical protein
VGREDAGTTITLASPKGSPPTLDPKSDRPENQTELTKASARHG